MVDVPAGPLAQLHPEPSPLLALPGAVAGGAGRDLRATSDTPTVGGPTSTATVGGPTSTAAVGGPTSTAAVGGPTDPPAVGGPTHTVAWHYGDPMVEQRRAERGVGLVDRTPREVLLVSGADRLSWLNNLTSQLLLGLADGSATEALILSPNGHIEHHFGVTELAGVTYLDTEAGRGTPLLDYLQRMKFWSDVEIAVSDLRQLSLIGPGAAEAGSAEAGSAEAGSAEAGSGEAGSGQTVGDDPAAALQVGTARKESDGFRRRTTWGVDIFTTEPLHVARRVITAGAVPVGSWADDALRIPTRRPLIGVDTDDRTIPNELRWLDDAVHLHKGCYRGQETVARVANLGRPPRRLAMLNLDGSQDLLPMTGDPVTANGRTVGRVGTVAHHHEDGPIALALVKRSIGPDVALLAGPVDARLDPADAIPDDAPPTSVIDRSAFLRIHRN